MNPHHNEYTLSAPTVTTAQVVALIDSNGHENDDHNRDTTGDSHPSREDRVWVSWPPYHDSVEAEVAIPLSTPLAVGDRVLLQKGERTHYVCGVLGTARRRQQEHSPETHSEASTLGHPRATRNGSVIQLRGRNDDLRVTFDLENDRLTLHGGAELHSPEDFAIRSGGKLSLGAEVVELSASQHILAQLRDSNGTQRSALGLTAAECRVASSKVALSSKQLRLDADNVECRADRFALTVRNLYQRVEDLSQRVAGRVRDLVRGRWQVNAKDARLRGSKGAHIQGDKIHIG